MPITAIPSTSPVHAVLPLLVALVILPGCNHRTEQQVSPDSSDAPRAPERAARPQEPDEPLPYIVEDVLFANTEADVRLAGTLTLPHTQDPHPAVVLISGSGPQDRDETIFGHKPFLVLADHLTRNGIAVLRYDDRGVASSTGNFGIATLSDFADDARAALNFLRSRSDIDAKRIGLLGHSSGGITGPMAALREPGKVAYLVLLAAPAMPGEQVLYQQDAAQAHAAGVDEAAIERSRKRKEEIFSVIKTEPDLASAAVKLKRTMRAMDLTPEERAEIDAEGVDIDALIASQIRQLNTRWYRSFLSYDPAGALERLEVPVLALIGERDLQVLASEHLHRIEAALKRGPCPRHVVREMPKLNHLFQTAETGLPSEYAQIEETFAPAALQFISDWIRSEVGFERMRD